MASKQPFLDGVMAEQRPGSYQTIKSGFHINSYGKLAVTFEWGAGHVEGGGRISPYRLDVAGRQILISDQRDAKHVRNWPSGGERIDVSEVGYWNGNDRIMVWFADTQVSKRLLML